MTTTDSAADIAARLAESSNATIYHDVELDHPTRVQLALEHDVHSVWDAVRGRWAFSRGVPEDQVMTYHALVDGPELSDGARHPYPERPAGQAVAEEPAPPVQAPANPGPSPTAVGNVAVDSSGAVPRDEPQPEPEPPQPKPNVAGMPADPNVPSPGI